MIANRRKGQYNIIEQVLLFALGLSITIGFLVAFEGLGGDVEEQMASSQSRLIAEYVASSSIELVEGGSSGRFVLDLPDTLAGRAYALRLGGEGVVVETTGSRAETSLKGLETRIQSGGAIEPGEGTTAVVHEDGKVELVVE